MRNSKLYWILQQFDKYEQNRLRKFLQSPYFNRSEAIVALFEHLTEHINDQNEAEIEKENLWKKINPDACYDDVRFRKYCSDLFKLIEDFLSLQVYENREFNQAVNLLEAIGKRKLDRIRGSAIKNVKRLSDLTFLRSSDYYLDQFHFEKNYYELHKHDRTSKTNIEEINRNLDGFYISEKLRYYCLSLGQQKVAAHTYNIEFIEEIIEYVRNGGFENIPSIAVYYQILLMEKDGQNLEHYFTLKQLLEINGLKFPREEAESMYGFAFNYCVSKINQGDLQFQSELFDLYKDSLSKEIIIVEGELSPWDFRNISTIALRLGEYDWVASFIEKYQFYLPEAFRDNAVKYNLAQVYFYQKKYDEVKSLLQEVVFEDFSYNLNSKVMLLLTYYETDEIEPLYSLFESFRTYLNRHKDLPLSRRQLYTNLIKFTKKLTSINPGDTKILEKVKKKLNPQKI
ncbi:MAG: hypothetical protein IPJ74_12580 [Saprospiraceae bacterium]|nr:hypothetical protein [Saprospiraceae bacterium]